MRWRRLQVRWRRLQVRCASSRRGPRGERDGDAQQRDGDGEHPEREATQARGRRERGDRGRRVGLRGREGDARLRRRDGRRGFAEHRRRGDRGLVGGVEGVGGEGEDVGARGAARDGALRARRLERDGGRGWDERRGHHRGLVGIELAQQRGERARPGGEGDRLHRVEGGRGGGEALVHREPEEGVDPALDGRRNVRSQRAQRRSLAAQHAEDHVAVLARKRPLPGEELERADAQREEVRAPVEGLSGGLLRGHVRQLALHEVALRLV